jgi:spermidine synthase
VYDRCQSGKNSGETTPSIAHFLPSSIREALVQHTPVQAVVEQQGITFAALVIYVVAFVVGAIVMSFEMLGSRYLNPYFGSGIYTWASLISTILAALTAGYFLGGWLADRKPSAPVLGITVLIGSIYLLFLPLFAQNLLELTLAGIDDIRTGSLVSSMAIMFFPVTFFGMYSPFAIRLLLRSAQNSGTVSGTVYGISTAGSIVGTLGTTFFLIPAIGSRAITLSLGTAGLVAGLLLIALPRFGRRLSAPVALVLLLVLTGGSTANESLVDEARRADLLKRKDGLVAHIETQHNDIFITKSRADLTMSFQLKGWDYTQSVTNLTDPDDLPVYCMRSMTTGVIYPQQPKTILLLGLGGGSLSTYLGRAMPDATIDVVEIDPGVINAAKKYFGIRETSRVRYFDNDARVYLNRNKKPYDFILIDAYHGGYVPFHLLTKEFYTLIKERLTPNGAAVFNVHDGTKLYVSTIKTLAAVFPTVHLYPSGEGEVAMVVTPVPAPDDATLAQRAAELQSRYAFRFPLPTLLARRIAMPSTRQGELITDDFAPVNLYDTIGERRRKRK